MNEKKLCIYHGNCADGFGAAWAVRAALGDVDVEYFPGVYQQDPPDVTGRDVLLVDFSYKRPVLMAMAEKARTVVVIDHHKSAAEDLEGLNEPFVPTQAEKPHANYDPDALEIYAKFWKIAPLFAQFDMDRSGAGMAWDFFNPDKPRPPLIDHIEDRDLWRFALDGTREIQANVFSHPYDFAVWDELMAMPVDELRAEGRAIERKHFKDIAELVKVCQRPMIIGGQEVPAASLPYTLTSDAGHLMATNHPSKIGVCYWDTDRGRVFSLRSTEDGPDVSAIAKQYGGGGHAHAAGFEVPRDDPLAVA